MHECDESCSLPSGECLHVVIAVNGPMQLWQIGAHFGVSKQRIKQILLECLPKLKREFYNRGLSIEDFLKEGNARPAVAVGQRTYGREL